MELIKQVEVNIDYILKLIVQYHETNAKDKEILVDINRAIESSVELRNKKDLIEKFISSLDTSSSVDKDWLNFVEKNKKEELDQIIFEEKLKEKETYKFVEKSFKNGEVQGL